MRRLLVLTPARSAVGGVEVMINGMARGLPGRGWEVMVGCCSAPRFDRIDEYRRWNPNLTLVEIDGAKGTRQARIESLVKTIKQVRPDVVLSARIYDAYEAARRLKKRRYPFRFAITIQAFEPPYFFDARANRNVIDLCVTGGILARETVVEWSGLPAERVVDIPAGVLPPQKRPEPRTRRVPIRIAYLGRLIHTQKRIKDCLPFVTALDDLGVEYRFGLYGHGPEQAALSNALDPWVQSGKVFFEPWVTHDQIYDRVMPETDCVINFADFEGVPVAIREAMVHGAVPVMAAYEGCFSERIFTHGENALLFPVGDPRRAADLVRRLAREEGLLRRLSLAAMRSLTGKHLYEDTMDAWAQALTRCVSLPPKYGPFEGPPLLPDGRLARLGLPPWLAQRLRDLIGRRSVHLASGDEWPTNSHQTTAAAAQEIKEFARQRERLRAQEAGLAALVGGGLAA